MMIRCSQAWVSGFEPGCWYPIRLVRSYEGTYWKCEGHPLVALAICYAPSVWSEDVWASLEAVS